jgi:NAD(P)-dependent dehydrogenase (short-subunit alcohol dehydrogenase family)
VRNLILLGDRSDIAIGLKKFLEADGWNIFGWHRTQYLPITPWDVILCSIGQVAPVGLWQNTDSKTWTTAIESNLLLPLRLIHELWKHRNVGAQVCVMAGSNPNKIMPGYSAYNVGKMALLKAVEQLNDETDSKWFALAPGVVLTKIHKQTLEKNWPNDRLRQALKEGGVPLERIYECLKWCLEQSKEDIGGRNICVSDPYLVKAFNNDTWKLRRNES